MSSIEKRDANRYRVKFRVEGKQRSLTFDSEKGAKAWKKQLDALGAHAALALFNRGQVSPLTVGEYLERHINRLTGVTDGTIRGYRALVKNHMEPIAHIPLELLDRDAVAHWVNQLAKEKSSGKTIANIHGLLSGALNSAVSDKLISDNPCRGMRLPRTDHENTEMIFLTREEFEDLFSRIPVHYQPFILTLVGTGMRFGEATALTVGDVDLRTNSIRIRQAWKKTGLSQKELGPSKTKRSKRTVAMPPQVTQILEPLVDGRSSKEFLFLNQKGRPIGNAFGEKTWTKAVREFAGDTVKESHDKSGRKIWVVTKVGKGLHPRIHDLRHTFASWAIQSGVPLPVIQRQLGHESITTTVNTYGHLARSDFDALASSTATYLPSMRAITQ
jgi:integrase